MLEKMLSDHVIYAPQRINGDFDYLPLKDVEDIAFDFDRTRMSAKGIFLKPEQKLMTASRLNGKPRASDLDSTTQVLFGARPCDISAINLLPLLDHIDITYWRLAQEEPSDPTNLDIAIVEGSASNNDEIEELLEIRS